jgi:hypothetical protein
MKKLLGIPTTSHPAGGENTMRPTDSKVTPVRLLCNYFPNPDTQLNIAI